MANITIITVHGTGAADERNIGDKWWQKNSRFYNALLRLIKCKDGFILWDSFHWDGANSETSRISAGLSLYLHLMNNYERKKERYILIGHSHGGSVIREALLISSKRNRLSRLETWITVGTPFIKLRQASFSFFRFSYMKQLLMLLGFLYFVGIIYGTSAVCQKLEGASGCWIDTSNFQEKGEIQNSSYIRKTDLSKLVRWGVFSNSSNKFLFTSYSEYNNKSTKSIIFDISNESFFVLKNTNLFELNSYLGNVDSDFSICSRDIFTKNSCNSVLDIVSPSDAKLFSTMITQNANFPRTIFFSKDSDITSPYALYEVPHYNRQFNKIEHEFKLFKRTVFLDIIPNMLAYFSWAAIIPVFVFFLFRIFDFFGRNTNIALSRRVKDDSYMMLPEIVKLWVNLYHRHDEAVNMINSTLNIGNHIRTDKAVNKVSIIFSTLFTLALIAFAASPLSSILIDIFAGDEQYGMSGIGYLLIAGFFENLKYTESMVYIMSDFLAVDVKTLKLFNSINMAFWVVFLQSILISIILVLTYLFGKLSGIILNLFTHSTASDLAKQALQKAAFGCDISDMEPEWVGFEPFEYKGAWREIPEAPTTAIDMYVDGNVSDTAYRFRESVASNRNSEIDIVQILNYTFKYDELIHTSYFDVAEFIELLAAAIVIKTGAIEISEFKNFERAEKWFYQLEIH